MGTGEDSSSQQQDRVGTLINDRYRVLRLIGSGSTGAVYLCQHEALDKLVALKILHREMEQNASLVDRFKLEAKAASRLEHPNSVRVLDFGQDRSSGALFIAMEYIEGRDLLQVLEEDGPFSAERAVSVMSQILDVLGVAHSIGIVHRDLKPENIIVRPVVEEGVTRELVTVCDFGIAQFAPRRSGTHVEAESAGDDGVVAGTPAYMSPEQARAELQDARSDIYSAGVVLYQLMTLHLPFEADDAYELALKHCVETPPPPSRFGAVNPQLEEVCLKALSKSKSARYQTAREMRVALARALMVTPVPLADVDTMRLPALSPGRHWGRPRPLLPQSTPPGPLESAGRRSMLEMAASLPRQRGWLWSYSVGAAAVLGLILAFQLVRGVADGGGKRRSGDRQRTEHVVRPSSVRSLDGSGSARGGHPSLAAQAAGTETDLRASFAAEAAADRAAKLPSALSAPANPPTPARGARTSVREPAPQHAASAVPSVPISLAEFSTDPAPQEVGDVVQLPIPGLPAGGGELSEPVPAQPAPVLTQSQPAVPAPEVDAAVAAAAHPVTSPARHGEETPAAKKRPADAAVAAPAQLASADLPHAASPVQPSNPAATAPVKPAADGKDVKRPEPTLTAAVNPAVTAPASRANAAPLPAAKSSAPAAIERAHVEISGIAAKSAVSKSSIRNALNVTAMTECYRTALRGGGLSGEPLTGQIELTTSTSGSVTGANLAAPGLPGELRRCVEQVARRGRVREADTGAAQASITLAFLPR